MTEGSRSEIYDLGYRRYDGPRLGRRYAVRSLWAMSVRQTFGLGRGVLAKVLAFGLVACAMVPAFGQLVVGALAGGAFEIVSPEGYFDFVQIVVVLFTAVMSSDLVGSDRRHRTLPLYFSRPILRDDYVLAKVLALGTALLALTVLPQLVVFLGNLLGAAEPGRFLAEEGSDLVGIVVSGVLVSAQLASLGILVASLASRRVFATLSVLGLLLLTSATAGILAALLSPAGAAVVEVLSPLHVMRGTVLALFDALPPQPESFSGGPPSEQLAWAGLPGWAWVLALVLHTGLALALLVRRYRRSV